MAKRSKNKLKKRKQRQLKKAFKHSEKQSKEVAVNNTYLPPYKEPKEDTNKKHLERNKAYQKALDKVYNGAVIPLVNYSNAKSTLLHKCTVCGKEFYGKPGWLVTHENQKHVCYIDSVKSVDKKKRKKISEEEKLELHKLSKAGMSINKLVQNFEISKYMVTKILKEAGVK